MIYFSKLVIFCSLILHASVLLAEESTTIVEQESGAIEIDLRPTPVSKLSPWEQFSMRLSERQISAQKEAWAYGVSGGLVLLGAGIGLSESNDNLEKFAFALSQNLAVASIGYGVRLGTIGTDYNNFYNAVESVGSLSMDQKNQLLKGYYRSRKSYKRRERWIRLVSHGLVSTLNFYQGSQNKNRPVRDGLYFLGGVNLIALISLSLGDREK